jgi:hypothetical protein
MKFLCVCGVAILSEMLDSRLSSRNGNRPRSAMTNSNMEDIDGLQDFEFVNNELLLQQQQQQQNLRPVIE